MTDSDTEGSVVHTIWLVASLIGLGEILVGAIGLIVTDAQLSAFDSIYSMLIVVGVLWYLITLIAKYALLDD